MRVETREISRLICFAISISSCAPSRGRWLPLQLSLLSDNSTEDDTEQKKNLRFMKFNNFLSSSVARFSSSRSKKFHFHYWREEKETNLNKVVLFDGLRDANLHTEGPLSNHNCAFQLHHVTELLNASRPEKKRATGKLLQRKEISLNYLFQSKSFSWSCFALKKTRLCFSAREMSELPTATEIHCNRWEVLTASTLIWRLISATTHSESNTTTDKTPSTT